MRRWAPFGIVLAAMACSVGLAGCHHIHSHFGPTYFTADGSDRVAPRSRRAGKRSVVKRVVKPALEVSPGSRVRQFCGQRHVRFQRGQLQENMIEKARNNELCRQEYKA